jgi:type III secretion system FlhB-like substrate exporter
VESVEKAVALHYTPELPAPIIVAKGRGALAARIRALAREHDIQLVPMPEVTEGLIELPVGSLIPERFYQVIAELLVYVKSLS